MLIMGDPEHQIHVGHRRSAFNGVFIHTEMLHTADQADLLAGFAETCLPRLKSGSVETNGFFVGGAVETACTSIADQVKQMLDSYGWTDPSDDKRFRWDTKLLRTQGARFHHDAHNTFWQKSLFWVYVLEPGEADFRLPNLDLNVPLETGQLIVFDPLQPHGVGITGYKQYSSRQMTRHKRQLYLAGDMTYPHAFWSNVGVECRTAQLESGRFRNINDLMVDELSGDLVKKNYA